MNEYIDTAKGEYLASLNKNGLKNYKSFHNQLIDELSKHFITIHDENQNFIGCGIFCCYEYKENLLHFVLSAGHVISEIQKHGENIKIPINCLLQSQQKQGYVISYPHKYSVIDNKYDIGFVQGVYNCEKEGYKYFNIVSNDNFSYERNDDILIFGLNENRIKKAERKFFDNISDGLIVNGFQMPSKIEKIDAPFFYISYPNKIYMINPSENRPLKGTSPDPHGLSGSVVWEYKTKVVKPIGIIIERVNNRIKCIDFNQIIIFLNEQLAKS